MDPFVDVTVDTVTSDTVVIEKSAEFTQGPNAFGIFPTIPITFTQIAANAVPFIAINDEIITNSTGVDWTDFHFELLNGDDAVFVPGGGSGFFTTTPFDNQMFGPDNKTFWVDGFGLGPNGTDAVVADGTQWFPGDGATNGELVIQAAVGDGVNTPFTTFILKETPTPEPASLALLAAGSLLMLRREH